MRPTFRFLALALVILPAPILAGELHGRQNYKPFTVGDLLSIRRVADPQISPDGRWVAYTVSDTDRSANKRTGQIYLVSVSGGDPRQLTSGPQSATSPRWSPDGRTIAFVRAVDGSPQIWTIDVQGGELKKITSLAAGADGPVWSPDGKWIAFTSDVYPECPDESCNASRLKQAEDSKVKAKVITRLLYRHWDSWKDGRRTHIFVVSSSAGPARDLTPGDYDSPPFSLGGPDDYGFSPDSKELAFVRNTDKLEALSTNGDVFTVPVSGGEPHRLTGDNPANDLSPQYSPDGRYIAYRAQAQQGFESDRWRLMLYDRKTGQTRSLTDEVDSWVGSFAFAPAAQSIYFVAEERGRHPVYEVSTNGGSARKVVADGFNDDVKVTPDGKTLIVTRQSLTSPVEINRVDLAGHTATRITKTNDELIASFGLKPAEELTWEGAGGTKVHGFLVKPANFTLSKKWPLVVLIHGGPQGAWEDAWSYRWNAQVFAAAGYVVFAPNPRGSTGYGQKFLDEISGDWGGKVYTDIMNGVAEVASMPFIDKDKIAAAGASFGGYMIDWIEGHNADPRFQFKVLVSHDGVFNLASMYGATEELWFPEWEFKGTPWTNPEMYTRFSPHMFVKNFKTPMLIIHSEKDYRVPVTEGLQLFTALQRQGVESKLLYFPDENHWVLKPLNSELWYNTVLEWLDGHLKARSE